MMKKRTFGVLALFLPAMILQVACEARGGKEVGPRQVPSQLRVVWTGEKVAVDYRLRNATRETLEFEFRNSGRVCGVIRHPQGPELYRFPQITAQVMGRERLSPGERIRFYHEVLRQQLDELLPGTYSVEAWPCGYPKLRAVAEFEIPAR